MVPGVHWVTSWPPALQVEFPRCHDRPENRSSPCCWLYSRHQSTVRNTIHQLGDYGSTYLIFYWMSAHLGSLQLASRAGVPDGVLNVITTEANLQDIGKELTTNPLIKKVSFTGSTRVGKILAGQASGTLKKMSLELGG